jgi:hypothetical protein
MKTKKEIETERRKKRKSEDRIIQRYLDENNLPVKAEDLNVWDRGSLLDKLRGL